MRRFLLSLVCACAAAFAVASEIVVVAHEPGYYTSLAKHVQRWLKEQDVAADLATPQTMAAAMKDASLTFLVGFNEPTSAELKTIRANRATGGRFVVFYSESPALAEMMGVKPLGYKTAAYPGQWSRMDFAGNFLEGCPASIRQTSTCLQKAAAIPGKGRVMATWSDRSGKSTGEPAWIASSAGYWMTHVLLADGDEDLKAQLLGAFVGSVAPKLWSARRFAAKRQAEHASVSAFAKKQVPRPNEIHAVWDHTGCGLYPGDWSRTMRLLKARGVTDLFVNVAGAGFAHYPSAVLPRSKTWEQEGDQLKACLAAAKGTGVRVHAWILCFNATRSSPETLALFQKRGWRLKDRDGKLTEYLDPSNAAVQKHLLAAIDEIQDRYTVNGIHLDFVRWYERSVRPATAAETITRFVASARRHVRRPALFTTAVLGKYPQCVETVGQAWPGWIDAGLVDYAVPMDYTEDFAKFESFLRQHAQTASRARRTIVGIGVTANESRLSPVQVIRQNLLVRRYGLAGVALFDLDTTLEKRILPYLKMGLW